MKSEVPASGMDRRETPDNVWICELTLSHQRVAVGRGMSGECMLEVKECCDEKLTTPQE
jgi:hypothetical protein